MEGESSAGDVESRLGGVRAYGSALEVVVGGGLVVVDGL